VSPVRYELDCYIPEGAILHSDRRENLKSYITCMFDKMNVTVPSEREKSVRGFH
jgi:hypothetical protein